MKFYIKTENRWTTLSACVDNQLFGAYPPNFFFEGGNTYKSCLDVEPTMFNVNGEYPNVRVFVDLSQAIKPDYKHISPEKWNDITNDFSNLSKQQMQDEIIKSFQGSIHNYYFGDTKKQEQELYRAIRRSLADMYNDGYHDGKQQLDRGYGAVQGKFDWILESVMEYMRAVINNKK